MNSEQRPLLAASTALDRSLAMRRLNACRVLLLARATGGFARQLGLLRFEDLIVALASPDRGPSQVADEESLLRCLLLELAGRQYPALAAYEENAVALAMRLVLEYVDRSSGHLDDGAYAGGLGWFTVFYPGGASQTNVL